MGKIYDEPCIDRQRPLPQQGIEEMLMQRLQEELQKRLTN